MNVKRRATVLRAKSSNGRTKKIIEAIIRGESNIVFIVFEDLSPPTSSISFLPFLLHILSPPPSSISFLPSPYSRSSSGPLSFPSTLAPMIFFPTLLKPSKSLMYIADHYYKMFQTKNTLCKNSQHLAKTTNNLLFKNMVAFKIHTLLSTYTCAFF